MNANLLSETRPEAAVPVYLAKQLRRLKPNELVSHGDFVEDGRSGFEPWEGPGGFRADSFVKPIYRKWTHRPIGARKQS